MTKNKPNNSQGYYIIIKNHQNRYKYTYIPKNYSTNKTQFPFFKTLFKTSFIITTIIITINLLKGIII